MPNNKLINSTISNSTNPYTGYYSSQSNITSLSDTISNMERVIGQLCEQIMDLEQTDFELRLKIMLLDKEGNLNRLSDLLKMYRGNLEDSNLVVALLEEYEKEQLG